MKADWRIPEVPEREYSKPPPGWIPVAGLFVALIAAVLYIVAHWKVGNTSVSDDLVTHTLFISFSIWGFLSGACYIPHEDRREKVRLWNWLCKDQFANWRHWTQWAVAIIDTAVTTPEPELAERMLGLEGTPPENPGKTPALQEGATSDPERVERVFEKLLTPLVRRFNQLSIKVHTRIILQADDDIYLLALQAVLKKLDVKYDPKGLSRIDGGRQAELIDGWLRRGEYDSYGRYIPAFNACLLVAVQLHRDGVAPTCAEAAVALLLTSTSVANEQGLKPQARLFRPVTAEPESTSEALQSLLAAQPAPLDKMRHMWFTHLPRLGRNNVMGALDDADLTLGRNDLDNALGKPGTANAWLVQALAAQAARYGQGTQLVATPDGQRVMLNLIGTQYAHVPDHREPPLVVMVPSISAFLAFLWALLLMLVPSERGGAMVFFGSIGLLFVLALVVQPLFLILGQRQIGEQFSDTLWRIKEK